MPLKEDVAKLYGLDGDWNELLFTAYNQTSNDLFFDFFKYSIEKVVY